MEDRRGAHKRAADEWKVVVGRTRAHWKDTGRDYVGREAGGWRDW